MTNRLAKLLIDLLCLCGIRAKKHKTFAAARLGTTTTKDNPNNGFVNELDSFQLHNRPDPSCLCAKNQSSDMEGVSDLKLPRAASDIVRLIRINYIHRHRIFSETATRKGFPFSNRAILSGGALLLDEELMRASMHKYFKMVPISVRVLRKILVIADAFCIDLLINSDWDHFLCTF